MLIVALTEGAGLALLVPILALLAENGHGGWMREALARAFAGIGVRLELPGLLVLFIVIVICRAFFLRQREVSLGELNAKFVNALRRRLFDAIACADWKLIAKERLSHLTKAMGADVEHVGRGTFFFLRLPALLVVALVQIAIALSLAPRLSMAVLACAGLVAALVRWRRGDVYPMARAAMRERRAVYDQISDFLDGLKLARSYNAEQRHRSAFAAAMREEEKRLRRLRTGAADARALVHVGGALALGGFVYVGATFASLPLPELLIMVAIFARLVPQMAEMLQSLDSVREMLPVYDELHTLIVRCERQAVVAPTPPSERMALRDVMTLSNVHFHYDGCDASVLRGVDLIIAAGSIVAIVGPSGVGKTTLADLITGLLTPDAGTIAIDGVVLDPARAFAWRRSIGYVGQENFLFNDTVRANLTWACPGASEEELTRFLSLTGADRFVAALPHGIDTPIGERGNRLSGGERQRLALARALLRQPTLLILDEATNALDAESEGDVVQAIERLRMAMTVLIITHRDTLTRYADRAVTLADGRIVEGHSAEALSRNQRIARMTQVGGL